jgi:hypothetical protein
MQTVESLQSQMAMAIHCVVIPDDLSRRLLNEAGFWLRKLAEENRGWQRRAESAEAQLAELHRSE